ncbi:ECF RNA polymerase sigma factor SigW [Planctomycetes bacterium CA13]|uniref:ECF RNA polymerase sigma factor SigW n=1 Tax=Novipirellula herctigrandis TaxID=2527986 RepID=A0A5C5Z0V3_9BACT|nr:ECF RNA polymerase sigma factor SigW [Planctomycetes bacterium CA13]
MADNLTGSNDILNDDDLKALGNQGFTLALRMLCDREDAADAVQDALLKWLGNPVRFDPNRGTLRSWFLKTVRNRCIDMQRKSRPVSASEAFDPIDPSMTLPEEQSANSELHNLVRQSLDKLPEDAKEIILLRDFHALSYSEISNVLGISSGTVMSRLHRSRKRLRDLVMSTTGAKER